MKPSVLELFSTPIVTFKIEEDTHELNQINNYTQSVISNYDNNNVSGSVTGKRILEQYPKIRDIFLDKFSNIAENYLKYKKRKYIITTSWITYTKKGGQSSNHNHRNSFWSGVYYFQDDYPKGSEHLKLNSTISGLGDVFFAKNDCQEICANNSEVVNIQPESKMLILFPSYLKHEVSIHQIDKKRLSLAFNIMPVGRWGESDSSIDLSWFDD